MFSLIISIAFEYMFLTVDIMYTIKLVCEEKRALKEGRMKNTQQKLKYKWVQKTFVEERNYMMKFKQGKKYSERGLIGIISAAVDLK